LVENLCGECVLSVKENRKIKTLPHERCDRNLPICKEKYAAHVVDKLPLRAGEHVEVKCGFLLDGVYWHAGIAVHDTEVLQIIHFARPDPSSSIKICRVSLGDFFNGSDEIRLITYDSKITREESADIAVEILNDEKYPPYNLLHNNCQHFVTECRLGKDNRFSHEVQDIGNGGAPAKFATAIINSIGTRVLEHTDNTCHRVAATTEMFIKNFESEEVEIPALGEIPSWQTVRNVIPGFGAAVKSLWDTVIQTPTELMKDFSGVSEVVKERRIKQLIDTASKAPPAQLTQKKRKDPPKAEDEMPALEDDSHTPEGKPTLWTRIFGKRGPEPMKVTYASNMPEPYVKKLTASDSATKRKQIFDEETIEHKDKKSKKDNGLSQITKETTTTSDISQCTEEQYVVIEDSLNHTRQKGSSVFGIENVPSVKNWNMINTDPQPTTMEESIPLTTTCYDDGETFIGLDLNDEN